MKRTSKHLREFPAAQAAPLPIVGDAAVATRAVGDGRLVPLVIVDASTRPDVVEMIRLHEHFGSGDVTTQWGQRETRSPAITLILEFVRPVELLLTLDFDVVRQGGLVDQIMLARTLYVQTGAAGDRLVTKLDRPRMLIGVPDTGFDAKWNELLHERLSKSLRRDHRLSGKAASEAARQVVGEWRKLGRARL